PACQWRGPGRYRRYVLRHDQEANLTTEFVRHMWQIWRPAPRTAIDTDRDAMRARSDTSLERPVAVRQLRHAHRFPISKVRHQLERCRGAQSNRDDAQRVVSAVNVDSSTVFFRTN